MSKVQKSVQACDRAAWQSLEIGILVVLLTGCMHYFITASSHFDFLIPDGELYLVTGAILLIIALSLVDFKDARYVLRHLDASHKKYAKYLSIAGIVLGIAILPPALIILAITIETQLLRLIQIKSLIELW